MTHASLFSGIGGFDYYEILGTQLYESIDELVERWNNLKIQPIPSFDEILEANRDVLERIKEKGD